MAKKTIDIEQLATRILSQHSFDFTSFSEARTTITCGEIEYTFDRLSLCVYSHNLDSDSFFELKHILSEKAEEKFNREEFKARNEYSVLFNLMVLQGIFSDFLISKETRPDFVLKNRETIGVEITELTTPEDEVLYRIAKDHFGKGKSSDEIKQEAIRKHGQNASEYSFMDIQGSAIIGRREFDTADQHEEYAEIIVAKFKKYRDHFSKYDRFLILCNGQNTICLTNREDSEKVLAFARKKEPDLSGFTLYILRSDDDGAYVADCFVL